MFRSEIAKINPCCIDLLKDNEDLFNIYGEGRKSAREGVAHARRLARPGSEPSAVSARAGTTVSRRQAPLVSSNDVDNKVITSAGLRQRESKTGIAIRARQRKRREPCDDWRETRLYDASSFYSWRVDRELPSWRPWNTSRAWSMEIRHISQTSPNEYDTTGSDRTIRASRASPWSTWIFVYTVVLTVGSLVREATTSGVSQFSRQVSERRAISRYFAEKRHIICKINIGMMFSSKNNYCWWKLVSEYYIVLPAKADLQMPKIF